MKKLNYLILGAAALTMASCSNDDPQAPNGDGNFAVTVRLPGDLATRAMSDGLTADDLHVAVYDANNGNALVTTADATFGEALETTVYLNLTNGKTYNIAFFAQSTESENVYVFDATAKTMTVHYENMLSDNNLADDYDCFYQLHNTGVVSNSNLGATVTLYRPVAQINWGTDDLGEDAIKDQGAFGDNGEYILTNLTLNAYTTFSLLDNDVIGDPEPVEIKAFAAPVDEAFPVFEPVMDPETGEATDENVFKYVAMQFILAPKDVALYDLNLDINNGLNTNVTEKTNDIVYVHSAPVQANYRTNIYGSLLTNPNVFTVVKDPNWYKPDYEVNATVWDGTTATTPVKNSAGEYAIYRASDLAGLAQMVSGGNSLEGETIILSADFDLGGNSLQIGSSSRSGNASSGNAFKGTFDGNGHTISNLTISGNYDANDAVGFIGNLDSNGVLKNMSFSNLNINAGAAEQAGVVGLLTNGASISNVSVESGSITATQGAGGIVGRILKSGTVTDCVNYADITVTDYNGGGIAGAAYYSADNACEMTISNCKNYGNVSATANGESKTIGGIVGTCAANVDGCVNYGTIGDKGFTAPAGGIVGYQNSCGSITNCINNGTVIGNAQVAGIVAFIGGITYTFVDDIYLTGNTNNGVLDGAGTVGGILGINRNGCYLQDNTNNAPSMKGSTVAGIVGNAMKSGTLADGYVHLISGNVNETPLENMSGTKVNALFTGTLYVGDILSTN